MSPSIQVCPDLPALLTVAQAAIAQIIVSTVQSQGSCSIALSGGSTPKPLYEALSREALPWEHLAIFWGDERYVPPDHPDSNQRMAREAWLDQVPIPGDRIFPMATSAADPATAAAAYEQVLRQALQTPPPDIPALDVILLGLGDDGHTASLFPHTAALQVHDQLITVGEKSGQPRLTFTVPLINQARHVIFLVSGTNKQAALSQIFATAADANQYPARLVCPQGQLLWFLDAAAAQGLPENLQSA